MSTAPLISICIPTYNGQKYVEDTLHSVLKQTYRPLELVVSDDNSIDRTIQIAERVLKNADFKCRIYHHTPEGMIHNWNYCVKQAQGEFIKFLFQDDLLAPECVAAMVALARTDLDIGLVFCRRGLLVEHDIACAPLAKYLIRGSRNLHSGWTQLRSVQAGTTLLADPKLLHGNLNKIGEPSCVLLRREVFDRIGWFNPAFCQLVDFEFWLRIMLHKKIGFLNQELAQFRIHAGQYSLHNHQSGDAGEDWKQFFSGCGRDRSDHIYIQMRSGN